MSQLHGEGLVGKLQEGARLGGRVAEDWAPSPGDQHCACRRLLFRGASREDAGGRHPGAVFPGEWEALVPTAPVTPVTRAPVSPSAPTLSALPSAPALRLVHTAVSRARKLPETLPRPETSGRGIRGTAPESGTSSPFTTVITSPLSTSGTWPAAQAHFVARTQVAEPLHGPWRPVQWSVPQGPTRSPLTGVSAVAVRPVAELNFLSL